MLGFRARLGKRKKMVCVCVCVREREREGNQERATLWSAFAFESLLTKLG